MRVGDRDYRTVWMEGSTVYLINQNRLPFNFEICQATNYLETCYVIEDMTVRGAGAIETTAAYAVAQSFLEAPKDYVLGYAKIAKKIIESTRPTARNLFYATERVFNAAVDSENPVEATLVEAQRTADDGVKACLTMGELGNNNLIKDGSRVMTHCNAGWLAFPDWGSALSPIYVAHRSGKKVFVYVSRTGPRDQGARLTAWELQNEGVKHKIFDDNAAAYLMYKREVDMVIVGADRIARNGDVANKIGTCLKAIAAKRYGIPFYVAAPTSTIDLNCQSGMDIPIEQRSEDEVLYKTGQTKDGRLETILVCSPGSPAINPAFDVTLAEDITAIITEEGIIKPTEEAIRKLFERV